MNDNRFFQQALETAERENAKPGDIVDAFNMRVHRNGISPTITTRPEGKKNGYSAGSGGQKEYERREDG